ncbi:MAG: (deoxy)nucleoside triphosphate pyrophosphohydrolase [Acidobacteriota bacterium]|nr:(deoxy)nucleoside triphosphate pyrophosphohydrolase [Acidobacteriota bacterium]
MAALLERGDRVLVAQRRADGAHPLKWEFPGGKVEPGEPHLSALVRELREELAIQVQSASEVTRYEFQYPGRPPVLLVFYRVNSFTGEPRNLVFERIEWTPRSHMEEYDFLDGDIDFIATLRTTAQ